jgi:hypothetical protein
MTDKRVFMYRHNPQAEGGVEAHCFDEPAQVPKGEGWVDHPDKAKAAAKAVTKKKPVVEDDDD